MSGERGGSSRPGADAEPQAVGRGGLRAQATGQVDRLGESGQASRKNDDRRGVPPAAILKARRRAVCDEGESIRDEGIQPCDRPWYLCGGGHLVETVCGRDTRA